MSIVFTDGFDLYGTMSDYVRRGWVQGSASIGALQTGRFGGRAGQLTNGNNQLTRLPIVSTNTISFGMAVKFSSLFGWGANGGEFLQLQNVGSTILRLGITNSGHIRLGRGDFTTNLVCGSASGVIITNNWHYVEVEITRNSSTGAATIYVDGVSVATASGVNTGASAFDAFGLNGGFETWVFDDIYITDVATKLGEMRVETIRPVTPDTATKDFTRSTGANNFDNVDDSQTDDDTTYNFSSTVGHKDLFDMANLSATPVSIKAVVPVVFARKDDAGTKTIRHNMKNGSTTTNGTSRNLTAGYLAYVNYYETNPDTAAAFTGANVNAMQLGYEVVA